MNGENKNVTTGPLQGLSVIEIGGMGPGPFGAMILADLGADVIRVDRASGASLPGPNHDFRLEIMHRGRRSIAVDLKNEAGAEVILSLVEKADVLIEGFRPGVMERLGLGPDTCLGRNPRLIYGRMTGFGQEGPWAQEVGHDINYVAASGMLSLIGRKNAPPTAPLSLVGDFGGGGMLLVLGVLAALWETARSGKGQVVDAAMVDGASLLGTAFFGFMQTGSWNPERGTNLVDSGAPFYDAYETADNKWVSVGALEPHFYSELLEVMELKPESLPGAQYDQNAWPEMKEIFAQRFRERTREDWVQAAAGKNACLSPVLGVDEAPETEHAKARESFVDVEGIIQPAPAPRFSRTSATVDRPPPLPGEHTTEILEDWGITPEQIDSWYQVGAIVDESISVQQ